MATRYWVGGTGTFNAALTTNWSTASAVTFTGSCSGTTLTTTGSPALVTGMTVFVTSTTNIGTITGGSGNTWTVSIGGTVASSVISAATVGASAPTLVDDIIMDSNSSVGNRSFSVTWGGGNCRNWTMSGFSASNPLTLLSNTGMQVYGDISWTGPSITVNCSNILNIVGTGVAGTMLATGITYVTSYIQFVLNRPSGSLSLLSSVTFGSMTFTAGTLNTNDYAINTGSGAYTFSYNGTVGTPTVLNFGTSVVTLNGTGGIAFSTVNAGLTFNASTATFNYNAQATLNLGGLNWGNFVLGILTGSTSMAAPSNTITGSNTFASFTILETTAAGSKLTSFTANQTITGAFTCVGSTILKRNVVMSNPRQYSTRVILTCGSVVVDNVDFYAIEFAGVASVTGANLGDCGYNSNITFPSAKTVYWNLAAGGTFYSTAWATTNGGTVDIANFPLPQDTATFTNTGLNTSATVTNSFTCPNIDATARTLAWNLTMGGSSWVPGGWNIPQSNCTVGGTPYMAGYSKTYTSASTFTAGLIVSSYGDVTMATTGTLANFFFNGGNITLANSINVSTNGNFVQNIGGGSAALTLNMVTHSLNIPGNFQSGGTIRTLNFGTGAINLISSAGGSSTITGTGMTVTGTRTINVTQSGASTSVQTISLTGYTEANALDINVNCTRTFALTLSANSLIRNLNITALPGSLTNNILTLYGDLTLPASGGTYTAGTNAWTFGLSTGTQTITSNGRTLDWPLTKSGAGTLATSGNLTMGSTRAFTFSLGTLSIGAGTTMTVGSFVSSGTTLKYLNSTVSGTEAFIAKASGTTTVTYMDIQDNTATGGTWDAQAPTNVDGGNNAGWLFLAALSTTFFLMFG